MNSSEISASAPARRATNAWPSSCSSVNTATEPASQMPNSPLSPRGTTASRIMKTMKP